MLRLLADCSSPTMNPTQNLHHKPTSCRDGGVNPDAAACLPEKQKEIMKSLIVAFSICTAVTVVVVLALAGCSYFVYPAFVLIFALIALHVEVGLVVGFSIRLCDLSAGRTKGQRQQHREHDVGESEDEDESRCCCSPETEVRVLRVLLVVLPVVLVWSALLAISVAIATPFMWYYMLIGIIAAVVLGGIAFTVLVTLIVLICRCVWLTRKLRAAVTPETVQLESVVSDLQEQSTIGSSPKEEVGVKTPQWGGEKETGSGEGEKEMSEDEEVVYEDVYVDEDGMVINTEVEIEYADAEEGGEREVEYVYVDV